MKETIEKSNGKVVNRVLSASASDVVTIQAPNFQTVCFRIIGNSPYVQNKFSQKARQQMKEKQEAGSTGKKGKQREAKDFQELYLQSLHVSQDGWYGIPAPSFRNALISSCKLVGFHMTKAKLSLFTIQDGFDVDDGTPLVKITKGQPHYFESLVRLETGVADIRPRGMWDAGWEADVNMRFDADQFTANDVLNLMLRVGLQVGIGEGRPDSKSSNGMGWGTFDVTSDYKVKGSKK